MQLNSFKNINFKSTNYPIKPFDYKTKQGTLHFEEINSSNYLNKEETLKNYITHVNDSFNEKITDIEDDMSLYNSLLKDNKDTTILVGKNDNQYVCATILCEPFPKDEDDDTLIIEDVAVAEKYRKNGVASTMLEKVVPPRMSGFKNVVLIAQDEKIPFYTTNGYKIYKNKDLSNLLEDGLNFMEKKIS